jgi:UBX domain-containing protein 7
MEDENISTFIAITNASADVARGFIRIGGNVERAVELYFENPDLVSGVQADTNRSSTSTTATTTAHASRPAGGQNPNNVIHIPSDDENDDAMVTISDDEGDARATAVAAAAIAQEEEDAAMAKRLQEELYGSGGGGDGGGAGGIDDEVRAPIARTTETLVAPDPLWGRDAGLPPIYDHSMLRDQIRQTRPGPGMYYSPPSLTLDPKALREPR